MSLRGLLVLVGLLAAVVVTLFWLGRGAPPPEAPALEARLVPEFADDAVRKIDLECAGTTVTLERRSSRGWRVTGPFEAEADPRRVREVVAALQNARVRTVIADTAAELAAFGLAPAACTVRVGFESGASPVTLRLGRVSPVGSERYAATDEARVVLADGSLYGVVAKGADAFRERRLIPVDAEGITRIALDRPGGRLVVALREGAWRVEEPRPDAASASACTALSRAVASIELAVSDAVRAPRNVRSERRLRLEVTERGAETPFTAFVAAAGIDGKRLGWREGEALAGLVDDSDSRELERPSDSFREARVAAFSTPDVRRLTLERGGTTLRIARTGEASAWSGAEGSRGFAVDGARVDALLELVRSLRGSGFEPDEPASEATGTIILEGDRGELARLTWGPLGTPSGSDASSLWMTTPARPGAVFRVEAAGFGPIPTKAADFAPEATPTAETADGS